MSDEQPLNEREFIEKVVDAALGLQLEEALAGSLAALATQDSEEKVYDAQGNPLGQKQEVSKAIVSAEEALQKPDFKQKICPALLSASDDIKDIAKIISAVLLPMALTPQAVIPLSPLAFAAVALVASRAGIQSLCHDHKS